MANHHCFAFNCTNKKHFGVINGKGQVTISQSEAWNTWKYLELANVRFFPFLQENANNYCTAGMSERERRMGCSCGLQPVARTV